ncbi:hypothetical protein [Photobacterium phosphoreum]|uniref:hypothetical protein n=1 Tax=Photobacterium phosphoreum TaxID=659 RepID=UPI00215993CD|nr:hypothetical protein [Photobacterium phosphoreum]
MAAMFFKNKQQTLEIKYDDLISELQDVVVKQYSQYGVTLIKKNINDSSLELCFNVGHNELIAMNFNKKPAIEII